MVGYETIIAVFLALLITAVLGKPIIPFLKKLKFGQEIREEGPSWHKNKQGTPTMGGIMIIFGYLLSMGITLLISVATKSFVNGELKIPFELTVFLSGNALALGMGAVGFIDDYIKVVKKRNLGLTAIQKTVLQLVVTASFLASLALGGLSTTYIPFVGDVSVTSGFGIIFWPIALFFVYGFVNAVNLTDGLDGLASSVTLVACCGMMLLSSFTSHSLNSVSAVALAGACIGFLFWNGHPAKVFMGDTGSLFIGGIIMGCAIGEGKLLAVIIMSMVFILDMLSSLWQRVYFKLTHGKRFFNKAPVHHHFQMLDWSEIKIVAVFFLISALFCAIGVLGVMLPL